MANMKVSAVFVTGAMWLALLLDGVSCQELLQNSGMDSMSHWDCWNIQCSASTDKHSGSHSIHATGRSHFYEGPQQFVSMAQGQTYSVSGWFKLDNDNGKGQSLQIEVDFTFSDNTHDYQTAASHENARSYDGWVHVSGRVTAPSRQFESARVYFQGPEPGVGFKADGASVTSSGGGGSQGGSSSTGGGTDSSTSPDPGHAIDSLRRSDINIHVTTASSINKGDVQIRILQTKKSFPFGTAVNRWKYNDHNNRCYRDFIHQHFNYAVPENALKWPEIEHNRGDQNYQPALDMINGLRSHGIKVRGHNLIWSVDQFVQGWVKGLYGNDLRNTVNAHIKQTMDRTQGKLENWDVINESLHGHFFKSRLNDQNYDVEVFRYAHQVDPSMPLFLNDYNVVANWGSTNDYLAQANRIKAAGVGLAGLGAQCHFGNEEYPNPSGIRDRLNKLAESGLPIWITELDVQAADENKRADFYEAALKAFYEHPAVHGVLMWGFWDKAHWRGDKAALVSGDDCHVTAAGRRVIDLYERQWMTDETHSLSQSGNSFKIRGFHGDYEVHVLYQGRELTALKQTFTLNKNQAHTVNLNVHT